MNQFDDDTHLFREYMEDPRSFPKTPQTQQEDEDDEETEPFFTSQFMDPISGDAKLAFFNTDMRPEDKRKLIQGKYRVEDSLDLHGLTSHEAAFAINDFLKSCQRDGLRCVQLIHGRGNMTGHAILKTKVNAWLPQSPYVIAYCSCLPKHGGVGAVYVLLRA